MGELIVFFMFFWLNECFAAYVFYLPLLLFYYFLQLF